MLKAVLEIGSGNEDMIVSCLQPELEHEFPRTEISLKKENNKVLIEINAKDSSSMRAALNSYLGSIKIIEDVTKITGD